MGSWKRLLRAGLVLSGTLVVLGSLPVLLSAVDEIGPRPADPQSKQARYRKEQSTILYFPAVFSKDITPVGPDYGVNFISSAEAPADEQQYQNGLATGARWNRWPIYWYNVEGSPSSFDWTAQDRVVRGDISHGLETNAILLGTPIFYTTLQRDLGVDKRTEQYGNYALRAQQAAAPQGLYEPVFADGTDVPGPGKGINEENVWARFVYRTVDRYRPGGVLAQMDGWPDGAGITHWEMWNEPDLQWFWDSSLADYSRLLKVGYLATHQAHSSAQVLFGGLANNFERLTYYEEVLDIFGADPLAEQFGNFHDILATHSYFYAWQSWYHVWRAKNAMASRGLSKPIWLNETGVAAWNDYPGPVWDPTSSYRATTIEQADYVVQTAMYALFAGAQSIFHFQLYDGCGNQPEGTDFPPHDGSLCNDPNYPLCAGDANGLFRNPRDAVCFSQHPQPETPRPNFRAFQTLTNYLTDVYPYWRLRPGGSGPYDGPQEWIAFYRPASKERIVGMWSREGTEQTAVITATHSSALLLTPDGVAQVIEPVDGAYTLQLPGATNQNAPWDPDFYPIGGRPVILIESDLTPLGTQLTARESDEALNPSLNFDKVELLSSGNGP